ncbi:MAG: aminotransferase class I/II-fold pyridoxal phosphate-dependent enzyme [Sphingobacteriales bacterium]|nr:MAG: aminotransferase class I/II-fold pyridoxal phosphate-dependent enzyme [Sphingobacteriales bacterium]
MNQIEFSNASFRDFENIPGLDAVQRAGEFQRFLNYLRDKGHLNYRIESLSGCGPQMQLMLPGKTAALDAVCFVSNDYLGFTQHPEIKQALKGAVEEFGSGAGASPAIGGHFSYHQKLEERMAAFFKKEAAILFTTGYTANSASLQALLQKEDIAIVDMAVHASVYEGCQLTNVKTFMHENMDALELALKHAQHTFRTKMVIVDGVYSQDGDIASLDRISQLARKYGALLMVDDAHGTGVVGETGRGVIEMFGLFDKVDIVSGTFSKALGHIGGYVAASRDLVDFLKYQAKQHLFSTTSTPNTVGILKALDLLDSEPFWKDRLWENIAYLKAGLVGMGYQVGTTASAIIPVKIGEIAKTLEAGKLLLEAGVYANPIMYPAVSKKNARVRLNVMATHTRAHLDKALEAFDHVGRKLSLGKF